MSGFHVAGPDKIKAGRVTDVYFERGLQVLKSRNLDARVVGEVRAATLPDEWSFAVFAGLEETLELLAGLPVNVKAVPEGTLFAAEEPVLTIEGSYQAFCVYETALLGLLCQASGVATKAARCKHAAGGRSVFSFGARRMHPAISPMIERNAYIGGCDGVAVGESATLIGEEPIGTMAHALIIVFGDEAEAFRAFDETIDSDVRRVALVDTFQDEKFGALTAAHTLGDRLWAVRLDTPRSRRGSFEAILKEVRWELDLAGYAHVKIFVSGGLDERAIEQCNPFVAAYGVGTAISNARVVDFSLDLVEVDGRPRAKRGKMAGRKELRRCSECETTAVVPEGSAVSDCSCGGSVQSVTRSFMTDGRAVGAYPSPKEIRAHVLNQLGRRSQTL